MAHTTISGTTVAMGQSAFRITTTGNTNLAIGAGSIGAGSRGADSTGSFKTISVTSDIVLNGESLLERLARIETVLHIPVRDTLLETTYPKLKQIWINYTNEVEKYKTWETLK